MIKLENVSKRYDGRGHAVAALDEINLVIGRGQFAALLGPSGSGKSTLLNIIGGVDRPNSGRVRVAGVELGDLSAAQRDAFRLEHVGFVFQAFHLLGTLSAIDNIALPVLLAGGTATNARQRATALLDELGLADKAHRYPEELSGGEQQRVALARALVAQPRVLIADEPTGNLDSRTSEAILNLLRQTCRQRAVTVVMATHAPDSLAFADGAITLRDGRLIGYDAGLAHDAPPPPEATL